MPSWSLVLWFPDLKSHGLGENLLRELMLGAHGSDNIVGGVVGDDMRSLYNVRHTFFRWGRSNEP